MEGYKVCVYAIAKDEAKFAARWAESMSEADAVYVLDTGSSDDTVKILQAHGVNVRSEIITPWRFDAARNRSARRLSSAISCRSPSPVPMFPCAPDRLPMSRRRFLHFWDYPVRRKWTAAACYCPDSSAARRSSIMACSFAKASERPPTASINPMRTASSPPIRLPTSVASSPVRSMSSR